MSGTKTIMDLFEFLLQYKILTSFFVNRIPQKTNEMLSPTAPVISKPSRRNSLTGVQPLEISRRSSLEGVDHCKSKLLKVSHVLFLKAYWYVFDTGSFRSLEGVIVGNRNARTPPSVNCSSKTKWN